MFYGIVLQNKVEVIINGPYHACDGNDNWPTKTTTPKEIIEQHSMKDKQN